MARTKNSKNAKSNRDPKDKGFKGKGARENKDKDKSGINDTTTKGENDKESKPGDEGEKDQKESRSRTNDPAFYMHDAALATGAGTINLSTPYGGSVRVLKDVVWQRGTNDGVIKSNQGQAPGIMVLFTKPTIGETTDRNSPANVAAVELYINVRYVNSGRKNYDPADLFIGELAIADLYSFVMWVQRLYACAFSYSQVNWYIGKSLISAQHVDPDSIINNLAQFRYKINAFINKISSFACPKSLDLFKRRAFMYSGIFIENPEGFIKDQMYMFAPDGFYRYQLDSAGKGCLRYFTTHEGASVITVDRIYQMMDYMLENIFGDEDFGLMSGDIIKAYGNDLIGLAPMPESLVAVPTYDHDALRQIQNATYFSNIIRNSNWYDPDNEQTYRYEVPLSADENQYVPFGDIYQDANGNIVCHEAVPTTYAEDVYDLEADYLTSGKFVNFDSWDATPEEVLESTRLAYVGKDKMQVWIASSMRTEAVKSDKFKWNAPALVRKENGVRDPEGSFVPVNSLKALTLECGADIVTYVEVTFKDDFYPNKCRPTSMNNSVTMVPAATSATIREGLLFDYLMFAQFQFAPITHVLGTQDGIHVYWQQQVGSLMNYTTLPVETLRNMHECCMLSLMYTPGVSKVDNMK